MANVPISAFTVPANTVGIGATGYSLTGSASASFVDLAGTWSTSGTPTAIKLNITDTASNAASLLMNLQATVSGVTTSQFKVRKDGVTTVGNNLDIVYEGTTRLSIWPSLSQALAFRSDNFIGWSSNTTVPGTADVILGRRGTANLRLGAADTTGTTAPTPQFLSAQSWLSSTTNNQTGANFTIDGSQGTGTGAGGSIIFRVAPAGPTSNGVQNGLSAALTIGSNLSATFAGSIAFQDINGTVLNGEGLALASGRVGWRNGVGTSVDTILVRDAANTLALRNGANAQTFRVYNTTDGTNSEYGFMKWNGTTFEIGAEKTGTGNNRNVTIRSNSGILAFNDGNSAAQMTSGQFSFGTRSLTQVINVEMSGYTQMSEMTAPAAPAANGVRIYAVDNGSGKTQLMALFATGAAQQIAIEP
jgi:hypothetical protein